MVRNDYKCVVCENVQEFYSEPQEECKKCGNIAWKIVFTTVPQVCLNTASVFEKIDEINGKLEREAIYESLDNPDGW